MPRLSSLLGALAIATLALACDTSRSSTTTTTGATSGRDASAADDLVQAGRDLGSATRKAAGEAGRTIADEAKKEARDLDVHVVTGHDAGR